MVLFCRKCLLLLSNTAYVDCCCTVYTCAWKWKWK